MGIAGCKSCPIEESLCHATQVFIHDPLYKWGLTPGQKQQRQRDENGEAQPAAPTAAAGPGEHTVKNADAERTVLRVRAKLLGTETGLHPICGFSSNLWHYLDCKC